MGTAYGARTTPHMYVINSGGTLVYNGGIDDKPTTDKADIEGARNHVLAALSELKAGKPVSVPTSRPYGCGVNYQNLPDRRGLNGFTLKCRGVLYERYSEVGRFDDD